MTNSMNSYVNTMTSIQDAEILAGIEERYGAQLQALSNRQKTAWLIVLITEAIELEGIEIDYERVSMVPRPELFGLSYSAKLSLSKAIINQLPF